MSELVVSRDEVSEIDTISSNIPPVWADDQKKLGCGLDELGKVWIRD